MNAVERGMRSTPLGIVLDAETAAVVPDGAKQSFYSAEGYYCGAGTVRGRALAGWTLTHLPTPTGLRPVAELVAAHDEAEADAEVLRGIADWVLAGDNAAQAVNDDLNVIADRIDERRAKAIDPRLVAAAHAQWADTEGEPT